MKALIVGLVIAAFAVFAALPAPGLGWWKEVVFVLKGFIPILGILIGFVAVLIGVADLKDARAEKTETASEGSDET